MHVRIEIPIDWAALAGNPVGYLPGGIAAKRSGLIREFMKESRLGDILRRHDVKFKVLDTYVFAVLTDEIYVEIMMAFDYDLKIYKQNNAEQFSTE